MGAAALRLEIPHNQQQTQQVLLVPYQEGPIKVRDVVIVTSPVWSLQNQQILLLGLVS